MERLRILAAAAALKEFTALELVAFSGANENTVRSVLHREKELFEPVEGEARREGKGRPANLYRVIDLGGIREEVRELEQVIESIPPAAITWLPETESEQERLAAIVVAEDAALRAWRSESPEEKLVLAQTARRSLGQAKLDEVEGEVSAALVTRVESVSAFTTLAESEARGDSIEPALINRAWSALADYADVVPTDRVHEVMTSLADFAIRHDQLPPLAMLTEATVTPAEAMPEFGLEWTRLELDESHEALWAQSWARSLVDHQLVIGLVVYDGGMSDAALERSLGHVADWHMPAVVISDDVTPDVVVRASRVGAFSLPSSEGPGAVAETLRSALATLNRYKFFA